MFQPHTQPSRRLEQPQIRQHALIALCQHIQTCSPSSSRLWNVPRYPCTATLVHEAGSVSLEAVCLYVGTCRVWVQRVRHEPAVDLAARHEAAVAVHESHVGHAGSRRRHVFIDEVHTLRRTAQALATALQTVADQKRW